MYTEIKVKESTLQLSNFYYIHVLFINRTFTDIFFQEVFLLIYKLDFYYFGIISIDAAENSIHSKEKAEKKAMK